jgi:predicted negative regulator of RcsB-dependent stress response
MSHMNTIHLQEAPEPEPPHTVKWWWGEHSSGFFSIVILVAVAIAAWEVYANWEIVRDTVMSTIR